MVLSTRVIWYGAAVEKLLVQQYNMQGGPATSLFLALRHLALFVLLTKISETESSSVKPRIQVRFESADVNRANCHLRIVEIELDVPTDVFQTQIQTGVEEIRSCAPFGRSRRGSGSAGTFVASG